jgi:uncharacterized protein (DUF305 family)
MRRRVALLVAVASVVVASVTTAVAVTTADEDGPWFGHRDDMMSSRGYNAEDGRDSQSPGRPGPGWMMSDGMLGMMRPTWVGDEYAYLAEMVAHHEEAVAAAQQLQRSPRAQMREFGAAIIASQSAQIDQMQRWLAAFYPSRSGRVHYVPMMPDLTGLSGDRLDRAFLQDMVNHHMGAVMMSQQLLMRGAADHEQVRALAEAIRDEQHAEIIQMQQWLRQWFGSRLE